MRKWQIPVVLILLLLAGCAETQPPLATDAVALPSATAVELSSPAPMSATLAPATATSAPPTRTPPAAATPSPEPAATTPGAEPSATGAEPGTTPSPSDVTPTPLPEASSPWPVLLRELDFGVPAGNSYYPRALAVHPERGVVFARTTMQGFEVPGLLTAIDLDSGEVLAVIETGPDSFTEGGVAVDPVHGRVYVVNAGDSTCSVMDAVTLAPVTTLDGVDALDLDPEAGRLYTASRERLRALDLATHWVVAEAALSGVTEILALAVDRVAGQIYLAHRDAGGYALSLHDAATLALIRAVRLPGRPDQILADPGLPAVSTGATSGSRLHVTSNDGLQSYLWTLDAMGDLLDQQVLGDWFQHTYLALDAAGGRLFLGRDLYGEYRITILDRETLAEIGDIPLDTAPNGLVWDESGGRLLVSHTYANQIGAVAVESGREVTLATTAIGLVDLAVDPGRAHMYVTDTTGQLHVLDSDTADELAALPGEGSLAVDPAHGRFFTGGLGAEQVRIFDAGTLEQTAAIPTRAKPVADPFHGGLLLVQRGVYFASLETLTTTGVISDTLPQNPGFSPNPTAVDAVVDPGSGRIFAIISNGVPGSNGGTYLHVYEPGTLERILADTERSPWHLDIDPGTGRAYVSRAHLAGVSTSLLEDGRSYTARVEALYGRLRVDPALGRVYETTTGDRPGHLFILDASTLDVLQAVPIEAGFAIRALDPERHWLFLATEDGKVQVWAAQGGDPPAAAPAVRANLAEAGPYRLILPPGEEPAFALDRDYRLYRFAGGTSWLKLHGGLPDEWVLDVAFSPQFARDGLLFAALATGDRGFGVWKSEDGGDTWTLSSAGLTDLAVADLAVSPAFGQDRTLFAAARKGGLYRSTDGGAQWEPLADRYRPADAYSSTPGQLLLSPAYGTDRTLFLSHYGLQRSRDGGDSWQPLDVGATGYGQGHLALPPLGGANLSPDSRAGQTVLYFWTTTDPAVSVEVYRSTDGGDTWTRAGDGPPVTGYGAQRAAIAPDGMVYYIWSPYGDQEPVQLFRSASLLRQAGDQGPAWERKVGGPLLGITPLQLSEDGSALVTLDDRARIVRWAVKSLPWSPVAAPTPVPTARPLSTPSPTPASACAIEPHPFHSVWVAARDSLGCPTATAARIDLAVQRFEQGRLLWDSSNLQIYVLLGTGTWQVYPDTWQEGADPAYDANLPPPPQQPVRGFGKVWREKLGGPDAAIGWALEPERGLPGWWLPFKFGTLFWTDERLPGQEVAGAVYLLFDGGAWSAVPFTAP